MNARVIITMLALGAVLAAVSGCETDNNERQAVVCEVELTNEGAPVISAAINTGSNPADPSDDFVPLDMATFTFRARPYLSRTLTDTEGPFAWFHVTGYDLVWTPLNGAPAEISDYNMTGGGMDLVVPMDDETMHSILIVDPAMKQEPWFPQPTSSTIFTARLQINFRGHASGSEHEVVVPASLTVTFIPAVSDQ